MGRITPIRITKNDRAEYAKLVRNTKAKINRTNKKYGVDLSDKIDLPELERFETRAEFNEWKQKAQSFTNRNNLNFQFKMNPYGIVTSKADLHRIELDNKRAIRDAERRMKEQAKLETKQGESKVGMIAPNRNFVQQVNKFDFNKVRSYERLNSLREANKEKADPQFYDKKMIRFRDNFISILEQSLNSDADALVERLRGLAPDDFVELYDQYWMDFDFDMWDSEQILFGSHDEAMKKVSAMMSHIDTFERGGVNMDLKGF